MATYYDYKFHFANGDKFEVSNKPKRLDIDSLSRDKFISFGDEKVFTINTDQIISIEETPHEE